MLCFLFCRAYRQVVRDNLRATQVPLESSGEFCHLQADDGSVPVAAVAVLLVFLSGDVQPAGQTAHTPRRRGAGDLP